jgi:hypothetical protein
LEPDLENPLEIQASLKYCALKTLSTLGRVSLTSGISDDDDGTFALAVADAVAEHASKCRDDWRLELSNADEQ